MNFHLESHFNNVENIGEILNQMTEYFQPLKNETGQVTVKTGCFIYKITKL